MSNESKEEVLQEVEAVKAVYGLDCEIKQEFPPHLRVRMKPRTAEDVSQQFVEAILVIKASLKYPLEPPHLELIDTKGLDDNRHSFLLKELYKVSKGFQASPMLVALCEDQMLQKLSVEIFIAIYKRGSNVILTLRITSTLAQAAIEWLSDMNHPEGDCSFCLFPLVTEDDLGGTKPFMKLMSCFHCFHSDCFGRWWRWLQEQNNPEPNHSLGATADENVGEYYSIGAKSGERVVNCPVCRKVIHEKDIEHVQQFLTSDHADQVDDMGSLMDSSLSISETKRKEKFAEIYEAQKERGGIIEPKKLEVILPGMFLPTATNAATEPQNGDKHPAVKANVSGNASERKSISCDVDLPSSSSISGQGTEEVCRNTEHSEAYPAMDNVYKGRRAKNNVRRPYKKQQSQSQKPFSKTNKEKTSGNLCWVQKK